MRYDIYCWGPTTGEDGMFMRSFSSLEEAKELVNLLVGPRLHNRRAEVRDRNQDQKAVYSAERDSDGGVSTEAAIDSSLPRLRPSDLSERLNGASV